MSDKKVVTLHGAQKQWYVRNEAAGYSTQFYHLPPADVIVSDFMQAGGNLSKFLRKHIPNNQDHVVVAIQILNLLEDAPAHKREFERIRRHGDLVATFMAEDELNELANKAGEKNQLTAIKMLIDRQKNAGKQAKELDDPLDEALKKMGVKTE